jgi:hypothetical protein
VWPVLEEAMLLVVVVEAVVVVGAVEAQVLV